jgi:hypothetical protein
MDPQTNDSTNSAQKATQTHSIHILIQYSNNESVGFCNESNPFQAKLNNTSVYCLNRKVHSGMMAVKGVKELNK